MDGFLSTIDLTTVDLGFKISSGFLTLIIAAIVALIAYRQHKTSHDSLRLALYERRYKVYRGLMDFLSTVAEADVVSTEALFKFYADTDEKRFLFRKDVIDYLAEVRENAVSMRQIKRRIERSTTPDITLDELFEKETELETWFSLQIEQAQDAFQPYLGFYHRL
jgi:hypothetical protein